MCLTINNLCHKKGSKNGVFLPIVAERAFPVVKCVSEFADEPVLRTAFYGFPISFDDGKCELVSDVPWNDLGSIICLEDKVRHGIHAYTKLTKEIENCFDHCFLAVIPKGTKYYIGCCNDVVAERMIVYEKNIASGTVFV